MGKYVAYTRNGYKVGEISDTDPNAQITLNAWRSAGFIIKHITGTQSAPMQVSPRSSSSSSRSSSTTAVGNKKYVNVTITQPIEIKKIVGTKEQVVTIPSQQRIYSIVSRDQTMVPTTIERPVVRELSRYNTKAQIIIQEKTKNMPDTITRNEDIKPVFSTIRKERILLKYILKEQQVTIPKEKTVKTSLEKTETLTPKLITMQIEKTIEKPIPVPSEEITIPSTIVEKGGELVLSEEEFKKEFPQLWSAVARGQATQNQFVTINVPSDFIERNEFLLGLTKSSLSGYSVVQLRELLDIINDHISKLKSLDPRAYANLGGEAKVKQMISKLEKTKSVIQDLLESGITGIGEITTTKSIVKSNIRNMLVDAKRMLVALSPLMGAGTYERYLERLNELWSELNNNKIDDYNEFVNKATDIYNKIKDLFEKYKNYNPEKELDKKNPYSILALEMAKSGRLGKTEDWWNVEKRYDELEGKDWDELEPKTTTKIRYKIDETANALLLEPLYKEASKHMPEALASLGTGATMGAISSIPVVGQAYDVGVLASLGWKALETLFTPVERENAVKILNQLKNNPKELAQLLASLSLFAIGVKGGYKLGKLGQQAMKNQLTKTIDSILPKIKDPKLKTQLENLKKTIEEKPGFGTGEAVMTPEQTQISIGVKDNKITIDMAEQGKITIKNTKPLDNAIQEIKISGKALDRATALKIITDRLKVILKDAPKEKYDEIMKMIFSDETLLKQLLKGRVKSLEELLSNAKIGDTALIYERTTGITRQTGARPKRGYSEKVSAEATIKTPEGQKIEVGYTGDPKNPTVYIKNMDELAKKYPDLEKKVLEWYRKGIITDEVLTAFQEQLGLMREGIPPYVRESTAGKRARMIRKSMGTSENIAVATKDESLGVLIRKTLSETDRMSIDSITKQVIRATREGKGTYKIVRKTEMTLKGDYGDVSPKQIGQRINNLIDSITRDVRNLVENKGMSLDQAMDFVLKKKMLETRIKRNIRGSSRTRTTTGTGAGDEILLQFLLTREGEQIIKDIVRGQLRGERVSPLVVVEKTSDGRGVGLRGRLGEQTIRLGIIALATTGTIAEAGSLGQTTGKQGQNIITIERTIDRYTPIEKVIPIEKTEIIEDTFERTDVLKPVFINSVDEILVPSYKVREQEVLVPLQKTVQDTMEKTEVMKPLVIDRAKEIVLPSYKTTTQQVLVPVTEEQKTTIGQDLIVIPVYIEKEQPYYDVVYYPVQEQVGKPTPKPTVTPPVGTPPIPPLPPSYTARSTGGNIRVKVKGKRQKEKVVL